MYVVQIADLIIGKSVLVNRIGCTIDQDERHL